MDQSLIPKKNSLTRVFRAAIVLLKRVKKKRMSRMLTLATQSKTVKRRLSPPMTLTATSVKSTKMPGSSSNKTSS